MSTEMDWEKSALLIIDMQHDFAKSDGTAYIKETVEVVPDIAMMANLFRDNHIPILHIIRLYLEDGTNADLCRMQLIAQGCSIVAPDSNGATIVPELLPDSVEKYSEQSLLDGHIVQIATNDFVMYKPRWGAFFNTNLNEWLINRNINSLIIAGCNFPNCPRTTIYQASERDYKLAIVPETISQIYPKGIEELKNIGVNVYDWENLKKNVIG